MQKHDIPPGYKKSPVGIIPVEWEVVTFGEITLTSQYGVSYPSVNEGTHYIIGMKNIQDGQLIMKELSMVLMDEDEFEKCRLVSEDFLFNRTNSYDLVGKSVLIETDINATFASYLVRFKLKSDRVVPKFVYFFFNSDEAEKKLKAIATKAVSQANINPTVLQKNFLLPLPPLPEQQKIAAILAAWDRAIQTAEQLLQALRRRNKGLAQRLLSGKSLEKSWGTVSAAKIFQNVSIKNNNHKEPLLSATQEKGMIPRDMLETRVVMPTGETSSYKLVQKGDFVISLRSFQGGIEYSEYRGIVSPAYTVLRSKIEIEPLFFKHYFKSQTFIQRLASSVFGIRDGKQISFDNFSLLKLPFPPFPEQTRIATLLATADREAALHERRLHALREQKRGLMQALLTGRIRVKTE